MRSFQEFRWYTAVSPDAEPPKLGTAKVGLPNANRETASQTLTTSEPHRYAETAVDELSLLFPSKQPQPISQSGV